MRTASVTRRDEVLIGLLAVAHQRLGVVDLLGGDGPLGEGLHHLIAENLGADAGLGRRRMDTALVGNRDNCLAAAACGTEFGDLGLQRLQQRALLGKLARQGDVGVQALCQRPLESPAARGQIGVLLLE